MKNMKTTLLLVSLLWSSSVLYSQAPGFIGRKDVIHSDFFFIPRVTKFINGSADRYPSYFYTTKGIGYERVVSRRSLIGVDFDLSRNRDPSEYVDGVGTVIVNAWGLGFRFRFNPFLRKGWIAPLGPYFGWSIRPMLVTKKFIPDDGRQNTQLPAAFTGSVGFITGRTFPLSARLLMDVGVRCSITDVINYKRMSLGDRHRVFLYESDLIKFHIALSFLP